MKEKLLTKNFLLLILGQVSSLFGNFILKLALSMYVLEITGSAAVFAGILSLATIPTILLSPLGGILADRANRRNIMVALDTLTGGSVLCAALFLSGNNGLIVISILLVILSVLGAFETPTVQACIPSMLAGDNITKGNAIVNQVASISYLAAPMLGGIFYSAFGLKPVMFASILCFFVTALLECFIKLSFRATPNHKGILSTIKQDFLSSMQYIFKEQTGILKILLLIALSRFFVMGIVMVGLPYMIRTVLGLDAKYYGAAESSLAVAIILGSIAAGFLTGKLKTCRLSFILSALGLCLFSIFTVSLIQQKTPDEMIGKIMAYTSAVTLCVQPIGQVVYGFLFDRFSSSVYLVLIPSAIIIAVIGLLSAGSFKDFEEKSLVAGQGDS